jgi:oxygen-independent coproporphyrinogen-3 oxidase
MAGIYVHIPFCKQACHYCDFHFSTQLDKTNELVDALLKEIDLQRQYLEGEEVATLYFGGGTPSLLEISQLDKVINQIHKVFSVNPNMEFTLEANPDDLSLEKLTELKSAGVNRLSIGIQSFDDTVLRFLNRAHQSDDAKRSVENSRKAGIENISIDLIYAIPGQSEEQWKKNIETALALAPNHISSYSLTIEEKTVFGNWSKSGKFTSVIDDVAGSQLETLVEILENEGYNQYEVSNFAKPGFESQHNSSYWQRKKYLGIGPSAHSYNQVSRQHTIRNNHAYLQSIHKGVIPFEMELLTREDHVNEYLLTTLRTSWGTDLQMLNREWNYDLLHENKSYVLALTDNQLAVLEKNYLKLTRKGKLLADKIASDLFL